MINKEDVKVGLLVWWEAERLINKWSCPVVVTEVEDEWFKVKSLDDFKETDKLRMNDSIDESSRREMRICTLDEVQNYFENHKRSLKDAVVEKENALKSARRKLIKYEKDIKDFLKTI